MNVNRKHIKRFVRGIMTALPVASLLRRRREPVLPYILGGIGIVIAGGMVAVMMISPNTRKRAMLAAKNTYGKMSTRVEKLKNADALNNYIEQKDYPASGL
jgi:hypothetical protein